MLQYWSKDITGYTRCPLQTYGRAKLFLLRVKIKRRRQNTQYNK